MKWKEQLHIKNGPVIIDIHGHKKEQLCAILALLLFAFKVG